MKQHHAQQSDDAVFEMVLDSIGREDAEVEARTSRMVVPEHWHTTHAEGQLSVDILETEDHIIAVSTMAGAATEKIEIFIHNDLLTIRGERVFPLDAEAVMRYFHEECFWGAFSRTIVLPIDVEGARARATYKNGILTVLIPKKHPNASPVPIMIVEE